MFYEITQHFWIVVRLLTVFVGGLVIYMIIRKAREATSTKIHDRRTKDIDAALMDFVDSAKSNTSDSMSEVLQKANLGELAYLLDRIKNLPDTPRKKVLYKVILYSNRLKNIKRIAISKSPLRKKILSIRILGKLKDDTLVHELKAIIDTSNDPDIIYAVIQALGEIESSLAVDTIMSLLGTNKFSNSKISAILETIEHPILNHSLKRQKDKDSTVRFWVANFLGNYKDDIAFEALEEMLKDNDPNVRAAACESLGKIGNKKAVDFLHELLLDDFWFVRLHAIKALGQFLSTGSIKRIIPSLRDKNWWVRYNAKSTLKKFGPEVAPYMHPVLRDGDRFARNSAVEILEETGSADKMFDKLMFDTVSDEKTHNLFIDFIEAEGFLWLKSRLKQMDKEKRHFVMKLIEKEDLDMYEDTKDRIYHGESK
ncbi:MAG: HEAT repeat domain-containing protein [Candidatus Omnitrophica bacterium]|nr:HEAT repeat domain-containing protein [Candidatus Omnitrophota bacterium]